MTQAHNEATGEGRGVDIVDQRRLRAVVALGGVPTADLEDALQQVRLKLLEHEADKSRAPIRNPGAWAAVVASRVAIDWHRTTARELGLRQRLASRWERHEPPGLLGSDRSLALDMAAGLEELTDDHRQVVVLRYYMDLAIRDIATALELPEGTVKSRLHAAHSQLRKSVHITEESHSDHS